MWNCSRDISGRRELGFIVNDLLVESFPDMLDVEFTAKMEEDLDRVETAEADAYSALKPVLRTILKKKSMRR